MTLLSELGRRGTECGGCLRLFWGVPAFDAHRIGPHGNGRHCADGAELAKAGLALDERGVWTWVAEIGKPRRKGPIHPASRARTPGKPKSGESLYQPTPPHRTAAVPLGASKLLERTGVAVSS